MRDVLCSGITIIRTPPETACISHRWYATPRLPPQQWRGPQARNVQSGRFLQHPAGLTPSTKLAFGVDDGPGSSALPDSSTDRGMVSIAPGWGHGALCGRYSYRPPGWAVAPALESARAITSGRYWSCYRLPLGLRAVVRCQCVIGPRFQFEFKIER
jgi:hypothetical protein